MFPSPTQLHVDIFLDFFIGLRDSLWISLKWWVIFLESSTSSSCFSNSTGSSVVLALRNHPTDGFEHQRLEHVSNYESRPKNLKSLKLELKKVLIWALESKFLCLPIVVIGRNTFIIQNCLSGRQHEQILHGSFAYETKFNANIGCVMSLKWS